MRSTAKNDKSEMSQIIWDGWSIFQLYITIKLICWIYQLIMPFGMSRLENFFLIVLPIHVQWAGLSFSLTTTPSIPYNLSPFDRARIRQKSWSSPFSTSAWADRMVRNHLGHDPAIEHYCRRTSLFCGATWFGKPLWFIFELLVRHKWDERRDWSESCAN